jgi:methylmalonyl-CoA/ethylmalonyl-CoA epimerase
MPRITLNHIAIAVPDMQAALKFYRDALGLELHGMRDVDAEGVRIAFLPFDSDAARKHPPQLELVQPTREGTGIARWMARNTQGLHHICVEVDDIHAAMARAIRHGAQLINATPARHPDGTLYAFIHPKSAFGVLVELYQKTVASSQ